MEIARFLFLVLFFVTTAVFAHEKTFEVGDFDTIIISPHIEDILVQGDDTSVTIENAKVSMDKINVQVEGNTLRLYLDGAKTVTKSERVSSDDWNRKKSI